MATLSLGRLSSLWKQHLLSEFAGLKQACPEGVFVSMNPGDPALWSAVLFVRDGPYAPAVLRFHISFPDSYPRSPPLVTFQTDMFHPLITPLTTHMYTTDLQDGGLGVPAEQEMLPPGGFSLRHGFPEWYDRDKQTTAANGGSSSSKAIPVQPGGKAGQATPLLSPSLSSSSLPQQTPQEAPQPQPQPQSQSQSQGGGLPRYMQTDRRSISTYSILKYIRSTFDKEDILDSMPLSATGNPGAWHAWRTHRRKQGKVFPDDPSSTTTSHDDGGGGGSGSGSKVSAGVERETAAEQHDEEGKSEETTPQKAVSPTSMTRRPEDWNWDGVWEDRVKKGIASTLSESVLYGAAGGPDSLIHFLALEDGDIQTVKENLRRTLGVPV